VILGVERGGLVVGLDWRELQVVGAEDITKTGCRRMVLVIVWDYSCNPRINSFIRKGLNSGYGKKCYKMTTK
jgi:hypothetical protein